MVAVFYQSPGHSSLFLDKFFFSWLSVILQNGFRLNSWPFQHTRGSVVFKVRKLGNENSQVLPRNGGWDLAISV